MVTIGRIGAPFGVHGFVSVQSYTQPMEQMMQYEPWLIQRQDEFMPVTVAEWSIHGDKINVRFSDCTDPNHASHYTNLLIYTPRAQLPTIAENEFYWTDLEGLSVFNTEGIILGTVDYLFSAGSNDIMVIINPQTQKRHLIPFMIPQFILSVDLVNKKIIANWDPNF